MSNLLHVITSYDVFGPEKTTINECVALQNDGWHTSIVNLDWHPKPLFNEKATQAGAKCHSLDSGRGLSIGSLLALRKHFKSLGDGSIVHSHGYKSDVMTLISSIGLKIPIVTTIHGWTTENFKVRVYESIQVLCWRFYDRVFCVSNSYRKVALQKGLSESKLSLVYNGIITTNHNKLSPATNLKHEIVSNNEAVIAIIGRLSPEKGHSFFIEIAKKILDTGRKAKFIIVGEGDERKSIEGKILKLGISSNVLLLGHIDDMRSIYNLADIIAICSLREGLPNVMLESMLNFKPIVSFSIGGVPEVAGEEEGCLLVNPGNIDSFASKLCTLIDSSEKREALGKLGEARVRNNFSFESRILKIKEHYAELIANYSIKIGS